MTDLVNDASVFITAVRGGGAAAVRAGQLTDLFGDDDSRKACMEVVLEAMQVPDVHVAASAMKLLCTIAGGMFNRLGPYLERAIQISLSSLRSGSEDVTRNAIDFWCVIFRKCAPGAVREGAEVIALVVACAKSALPVLLQALTCQRQHESVDEMQSIASAAFTCLQAAATLLVDQPFYEHVSGWIRARIGSAKWQDRAGAFAALDAVANRDTMGTTWLRDYKGQMERVTSFAVPAIHELLVWGFECCVVGMDDPVLLVCEWAASAFKRICAFVTEPSFHQTIDFYPSAVETAVKGLQMRARVARQCCFACANLARGSQDRVDHYATMVTTLVEVTAGRVTAAAHGLREAEERESVVAVLALARRKGCQVARMPWELLCEVLAYCTPQDGLALDKSAYLALAVMMKELYFPDQQERRDLAQYMFLQLTERLNATCHLDIQSHEEAQRQAALQGSICTVLQVISKVLQYHFLPRYTDAAVALYVRVLDCGGRWNLAPSGQVWTALLEATEGFRTTGAAVAALMPALCPHLLRACDGFSKEASCAQKILATVLDAHPIDVHPYVPAFADLFIRNLETPTGSVVIADQQESLARMRGGYLRGLAGMAAATRDGFAPWLVKTLDLCIAACRGALEDPSPGQWMFNESAIADALTTWTDITLAVGATGVSDSEMARACRTAVDFIRDLCNDPRPMDNLLSAKAPLRTMLDAGAPGVSREEVESLLALLEERVTVIADW